MRNIRRYFKIYSVLIKLNVASTFAYRASFYSSLISSMGWSTYIILSMVLLTSRTSSVFGWSREELLLTAGVYNVILSIFYILFSRNFKQFADTIHYGKLDGILTKPIDSQFLMTCRNIVFGNIIRFTFGLLFIVYILAQSGIEVTVLSILGFLALLFVSVVIVYSFWMIIMTLIIWFTNLINLVDLLYDVNHVARFPQEMYRGASIFLFIAVFPLTFIVMSPAKVLLQNMLIGDVIWPIVCAIVLFFISRFFWKFALRSYTSASG